MIKLGFATRGDVRTPWRAIYSQGSKDLSSDQLDRLVWICEQLEVIRHYMNEFKIKSKPLFDSRHYDDDVSHLYCGDALDYYRDYSLNQLIQAADELSDQKRELLSSVAYKAMEEPV